MPDVLDLSATIMTAPSSEAPVLGKRPFRITGDDHRGIVLTMSILFAVYAVMVLGMRVASKYRSLGIEDWLAIAATVYLQHPAYDEQQLTCHPIGLCNTTVYDGYGGGVGWLWIFIYTLLPWRCWRRCKGFCFPGILTKCSY